MPMALSTSDVVFVFPAAIVGFLVGLYVIRRRRFDEKAIRARADKLVVVAQEEGRHLVGEATAHVVNSKKQFEIEQQEFVAQLDKMEQMLVAKNSFFQKREAKTQDIKRALTAEESSIGNMKSQINEANKKMEDQLIRITGMSESSAKEQLVQSYESEFLADAELRVQQKAEWAQECSLRDARNVLAEAIYRFGDSTSVENKYKDVIVPRDEIKGRIVGRGGRNVAFFENLFQVDVVFNDEPNTIMIGCFNLVQREIARFALERLMREKNINEEVILQIKTLAEQDIDKLLRKEGEDALRMVGLQNVAPDLTKLVGRLKFRTSYGQNILRHCFEVAYFARLLASEIGANEQVAWIAGFLHDIGKSIDQEVTGSHDVLTKEILEKYKFAPEIIHAAWTHHNAAPQETVEAKLIQAADAISAGRPGARAESLERYLAKIGELQETALSFDGVKKAYAINAGREVRVIVDPDRIKDGTLLPLASGIAAKVQEKGGYPGKIKIVAIRTTKATDHAK